MNNKSLKITATVQWSRKDPGRGVVVKHAPPEGMACRYRDVAVAGISYRVDAATAFVFGSNHRIELERAPTNHMDGNAIKVIGVWQDRGMSRREHLGYVPKDTAAKIAAKYATAPLEAVPIVVFQPDCDHETPGARFDIYTPRVKRAKAPARIESPSHP